MTRMTGAWQSILLLFIFGLVAGAGTSAATEVACGANQRELLVTNKSSQPVWIGGGGGALRSVCVVDANTSCLAAQSTIDGTTGACKCGTQDGTLACPGVSQATGAGTNGGLNCVLHTGFRLRPRRRMQREHQSLLFRAAESRGAFGCGGVYLEAIQVSQSAAAGGMG